MNVDDTVLVTDNPATLQWMIRDLVVSCDRSNLQINLDKPKIMIFGKSGRASARKKCFLKGGIIEVVKSYKYLGIRLTLKMTFNNHFHIKTSMAKTNINCLFSHFPELYRVSAEGKLKIFNALFKSVICYGSQVWSFEEYAEVEKFQRYFFKIRFNLPQFTPAQRPKFLCYTFKLHVIYTLKILN